MSCVKAGLMIVVVLQAGCSSWWQKNDVVLVREPDQRSYGDPIGAPRFTKYAKEYWEYVALAANSYHLKWPDYSRQLMSVNIKAVETPLDVRFHQACELNYSNQLIPTPDWYVWSNFPSKDLADLAEQAKLYFSVWEHRTGDNPTTVTEVAIVFRGTEADQKQDWFSNARWFIPTRLRGEDQYNVTKIQVAKAFEAELQTRIAQGKIPAKVNITAIGHSLGGGLAQQLAYALPRSPGHPIRVTKVIAFNSSPVTGWFTTDNPPRDENTRGLEIDRIFEHGEALAYIRLPINFIAPPDHRDSAVRDLRFNLHEKPGGVANHASHEFACRLAEVAGVYSQSTAPQRAVATRSTQSMDRSPKEGN
ncbi:lipase family protein [Pseudomonas sp. URMO17WK12:I11]|uniref:lipase family protein n=1 Tax=Pseudomonas sp. URMO17WK12:I11 TaxID=1283291 RepID=UPI00072154D1|nr:DUF6792 domain-containing protein [Pseudomonas sp. URMO17WK12:I11]CRL49668.1 Lipase (class 3) [Pseudomonas sp. URMO17WK12:I11]